VGLLENFEQRLDQLVNTPFQRAFKNAVEPVEIASRIQQLMDKRAAIISRGRTVVPNSFTVELSSSDFERLEDLVDTIQEELTGAIRDYAKEQRYTFQGRVSVTLDEDQTLDTGVFTVSAETKRDLHPPEQPAAAAGAGDYGGHPNLIVAGHTYPLTKSRTKIGRGVDADITVDDPGVSRNHAEIVLSTPPVVRDLSSTNGTALDGRKINESPLHDGARITVGSTTLTFRSA